MVCPCNWDIQLKESDLNQALTIAYFFIQEAQQKKASTAILAQATESKQNVLTVLQG